MYTYLDEDFCLHSKLFDKVMYWFREITKLSRMVHKEVYEGRKAEMYLDFVPYPTSAQLFYINKVLLLALKAKRVAQIAIENVKAGRNVVIAMSDTLECILSDLPSTEDGEVRGDISSLLLRLADKSIRSCGKQVCRNKPIFDYTIDNANSGVRLNEIRDYYYHIVEGIKEEVFYLPASLRSMSFDNSSVKSVLLPPTECVSISALRNALDVHVNSSTYLPRVMTTIYYASIKPRKKRHSNHIYNDFQNNKLDVILINACGASGASAHAVATREVPDNLVRQRKMLIVQNDLDVNIDLQKRGRINRTGQREDLPPLYEYIITAIPSEKRLNMMLRTKLRSLSANTSASQDQDKEQADFIDINNKYGTEVARAYFKERPLKASMLGISSKWVVIDQVLARIAMISVEEQQEILEELINAYILLEEELRRINQWDLEREFRNFEAEFVHEELFTKPQTSSRLGGASYLTTYLCKQKTFPYSFEHLLGLCAEAQAKFGAPYKENKTLQCEVESYYMQQCNQVREYFAERKALLYTETERAIQKYTPDPRLTTQWLEMAQTPYGLWSTSDIMTIGKHEQAESIRHKLISYSNEYQKLHHRERKENERYAAEKSRLINVLSRAIIGSGYSDIAHQFTEKGRESAPSRVIAVLRDIRFGRDNKSKFSPNKVEFVFALSAVQKDLSINLLHTSERSNYERLLSIMQLDRWSLVESVWNREIALNNTKIVERKIITGNILGAYVHPAIETLKPRFITFSLKGAVEEGVQKTQVGLLLPLAPEKIEAALDLVPIPLAEGMRYINDVSTNYTVSGIGINFTILPQRDKKGMLHFVVSVSTMKSKPFEIDSRFSKIRPYFDASPIQSIYQIVRREKKSSSDVVSYTTKALSFESEAFQSILQTFITLGAVIAVPRAQVTRGELKRLVSQAELNEQAAWTALNWRDAETIPVPPIRESLCSKIIAPCVGASESGEAVLRHSSLYNLAQKTMALFQKSLKDREVMLLFREIYLEWKNLKRANSLSHTQTKILLGLRQIFENRGQVEYISWRSDVQRALQGILDNEHLSRDGMLIARFEEEMFSFLLSVRSLKIF